MSKILSKEDFAKTLDEMWLEAAGTIWGAEQFQRPILASHEALRAKVQELAGLMRKMRPYVESSDFLSMAQVNAISESIAKVLEGIDV